MGALPTSDPVAFRFAPYIKELRELFDISHLRYGSPEDIFPVTERLQNSKAFAEDMSSMIRAILLREGGSMAHAQLLEILAIAIGGPAMDHAPQDYRQPLRQLLAFLTGVLRRPWNLPPGEEAEPPAPASVAKYTANSDTPNQDADQNQDRTPDRADIVAFPSGPFATAAALSAAEQKSAQSPHRQREPVDAAVVPKAPAVQTAPQPSPAITSPPLDPSPTQPEYSETDFVEYEALNSTPSTIQEQAAPAEVEPASALEAVPQEMPAEEPAPVMTHAAQEEPAPLQIRSNSELIDQLFHPGSLAVEDLQEEAASTPEPPLPEASSAPMETATPLASAEPASDALHAEHELAPEPTDSASLTPTHPAPVYLPVTGVAKWTARHHEPSLSNWQDSPFDDSDLPEIVPEPPAQHRSGGAAPWIANAPELSNGVPWWNSSSRRNLLIGIAAAVAVVVCLALTLRRTSPTEEAATSPKATAPATMPVPARSPAATSPTPQPVTNPSVASTKPSPYDDDDVIPQRPVTNRTRANSDEDADYAGSDVAAPTYRAFTSSAPATQTAETTAPPAPSGSNTEQPAPVERRTPTNSLVGNAEPVHQSFRNPDATLAGDPRPVRPPPPRSLNGEPTFKVSSGVMAANLISAPNPEYPTLARFTHTQGEVILQAVISRDGRVSATHVISGHHLLRGAAVDAVKRWRYRPYISDGHPVDVATIIRVDFRAHN